jgi:hypothetical protein
MGARAARFKEIDVTRAIKAAGKAGARDVRVEIEPDGRLVIITGAAALLPARKNSFD